MPGTLHRERIHLALDPARAAGILELLSLLGRAGDLETNWTLLAARLGELFECERIDLALLNEDRRTYRLRTLFEARAGVPEVWRGEVARERGLLGNLLRSGDDVLLSQAPLPPGEIADEWLEGGTLEHLAAALLGAESARLGALLLARAKAFTEAERELLAALSAPLGLALERASAVRRLDEARALLRAESEARLRSARECDELHARDEAHERAEAALRRSVRILESISDGFYSVDNEWRLTYVNAHAANYFGLTRDEMIGKRIWDLFPQSVGTVFDREYHRALREHRAIRFEAESPLTRRQLVVSVYPADQGLAIYFQDVTELRRQQDAAREAESIARATLDALAAHIAILDQAGTIIAVNRAWREFAAANSPRPESILEGANYLEACARARARGFADQTFIDGLREVISGRRDEFDHEYRYQTSDHRPQTTDFRPQTSDLSTSSNNDPEFRIALSTQHSALSTSSPLSTQHSALSTSSPLSTSSWFRVTMTRFAGDGVARVVVTHENITARKLAELERERLLASAQAARERAEEANRLKDEFLAVVSHELRTPLNAIVGWVRLLSDGRLDGDAARQAIETIERNARTQTRLVEDLLDVSRIMTGQLRIERRPVRISHIVGAALDAVRPVAEARQVSLVTTPIAGEEPGVVAGDATRLQQVVWNLLSNAIKFTPAGGQVEVAIACRGAMIEIEVRDNGIGIDPEFLPYVFDRFRQADSSTTRAYGGLGLGLAIVRHLVELHGGSVQAESEGKGRGATFTVRLPQAIAQRESTEQTE